MAMEGSVIACQTPSDWNRQILFANAARKLVVVDFTAPWCGPCRAIAPLFSELAEKFPGVIFLRVDVNQLKRVAMDLEVETLPTFVFLKEGRVVDRIVGARKDELPKKVLLHMPKY
ncbi:thioredoxin H1-like [Curcuma longa]|uniref:thioredoxin H1-like n=1 Tax=Curcuma longa TaxID=136217 RepID=UPI003D9E8FE3